jgi:predicted transcriptional regulator of viral defense system
MKSQLRKTLGPYESQALAFSQARERRTLASGELVSALKWTVPQERNVLSQLAKKGLIVRVRNGLYLVPPRLPPGGRWSPGEFMALSTLMDDCAGRYQVTGPSVFYRYGWTEQVSNRIYAYNNRISGDRQIGPSEFTLIKVADNRLGATEIVRVPEGVDFVYASRPRALFDAVYDWSRFNTLPQAYEWIAKECEREDFAADFVETAVRFGNQVTLRRIGVTLEQIGVAENLLRKIERQLTPASAYTPWLPGAARSGTTSKRWGIVFNDE